MEQALGGAATGAHRRPRPGDAALPAPALRRHAAARRHRDGAGVRPQAARARRADHRPRRAPSKPRSSTSCARCARETDAAILLIAHNLGVIRSMCDRVGVMYAGQDRRGGRRRRGLRGARSTRTRSGCCSAFPATACARPSGRCSRSRARCRRSARTLPTCVFVDRCATRRRAVPHRGATGRATVDDGTRRDASHQPLPPRRPARPDAGAADRGARERSVGGRIVIEMNDVSKTFRQHGHDDPGARRDPSSTSPAARRSASSASRDRARARSPRRCSASTSPTPAATIQLDDHVARRQGRRPRRSPTCGRCRWSSRTRTAR